MHAAPLFESLREGHVRLLKGTWLLRRAGFEASEKERKGRIVTTWVSVGQPEPLPCRQELEATDESAFISVEELEKSHAAFVETLEKVKSAKEAGVAAVPVVLASHVWETRTHPDPSGTSLLKVATELASELPTYQSWGFEDVGVFIDWSSLNQVGNGFQRTEAQEKGFKVAQSQMSMWYAHMQTTVYLDTTKKTSPPRSERGWPYFEEARLPPRPADPNPRHQPPARPPTTRWQVSCLLFKEPPPARPFKLPHGALAPFWHKVIDLSAPDRAGDKKRKPPLSAPHFVQTVRPAPAPAPPPWHTSPGPPSAGRRTPRRSASRWTSGSSVASTAASSRTASTG